MLQLSHAQGIAQELINILTPFCDRIEIAGSVRRKKNIVKDIELVIIPKKGIIHGGLFGDEISYYYPIDNFILHPNNMQFEYRFSADGKKAYGEKNKLLIYNHKEFGPVALDIFTADESNYMMVKFIRTGGAETNKLIATTANKLKMNLRIYESAFVDHKGYKAVMKSEEQIFQYLGLKYLKPEERT